MSVKSKLLDQIHQKAIRIKEMRVQAASNKTVESFVFEFFRNAEEVETMVQNKEDKYRLILEAHRTLADKMRTVDTFLRNDGVSINWTEEGHVQGVTIRWSSTYIQTNSCDPEVCVDVGQLLFL